MLFCVQANALESLSYSGRLVQTNGTPVTGTVNLRAELAYTNALGTVLCSDDISGVVLSKGVFHVKLDFACTGGKTLTQVLSLAPVGESVAIQITDMTNAKSYSFQAIHAIPYSNVSKVAVQLEQNGANDGEFLKWDNTAKLWKPGTVSGATGGTVTSVSVSAPLSVTTPTSTPSITLPQADTSTSGYLSAADWNAFNSKQGIIAAGTASQFYRGDKSWQTLDTLAVPENVNLYFTNARALGVPLTGFVTAAGAIVATDSTLEAFGKAQGQINAINTAAASYLVKNSTDSITGLVNVGTTGLLQLTYAPVGLNDATNKAYVDSEVGTKVSKAGDTMSGVLTLNNDLKIKGGSNHVTIKGHATSANYNFVLPQTAGTSGYFLQTDGSGNLTWVAESSTAAPSGAAGGDLAGTYPNPTVPGLANKISTTLTNGNILVGNGSNVATGVAVSGDATLSNAGVLTLANTAVTAGTYSSLTVDGKGRVTGGTNPVVVTGVSVTAPITNTGTATVPLIGMPAATGAVDGYLTSGNFTTFNNKQNAITATSNIAMRELRLNELTGNGTEYVALKSPDSVAANLTYTLPGTDGSNGQVLTTNASGVLSWTSIPSSLAPNGSAGGDLSGTYPNPTITGLAATKVGGGSVDNTEFNYLDGVTSSIQTQLSGKQASDTTLTALAAYNTNGILVQTAADTFTGRSIVGTANRVSITDGNGVAGNPTINIDTGLLPSPAGPGQWLKSTAANSSAWTTLGASDITTALGFTPINKAGDTISTGTIAFNAIGTLSLAYTPTNLTDATSKSYVDNAVATAANQWTVASGNVYRSSGNVGIGTNNPAAPLQLGTAVYLNEGLGSIASGADLRMGASGLISADDSMFLNIDGTNTGTGDFRINKGAHTSAATNLLIIKNSGNVGIGLTSPTEPLHITKNDGVTTGDHFLFRAEKSAAEGGVTIGYEADGTNFVAAKIKSSSTADLIFGTTGLSKMLTLKNNGTANFRGNNIPRFNPAMGMQFGDQDWTDYITVNSGTAVYSSADKGIKLTGNTWFTIHSRIPIDPKGTYRVTARIKKIDGTGTAYIGADSLDDSFTSISADSETAYNYFGLSNYTIAPGVTHTASGIISGHNVASGTGKDKFDPGAKYFNIVIIGNYSGTGNSVLEAIEIHKIPTLEPWITPAFQNGWSNYGGSYSQAGYYKDNNGIVHLRGLVAGGTVGGASCIFTLPVGYRPTSRLLLTTTSNSVLGRLDILPDGCVMPTVGDPAWYSIEGATFRTD